MNLSLQPRQNVIFAKKGKNLKNVLLTVFHLLPVQQFWFLFYIYNNVWFCLNNKTLKVINFMSQNAFNVFLRVLLIKVANYL
jgi:hypothetical protein